jgi:streptogramin lyase
MRTFLSVAVISSALLLAGCSGAPVVTPITTSSVQGAAIQGRVHGGQTALGGANLYLFAANKTGYGNASISLLTSSVLSQTPAGGRDGDGNYYVTTGADGSFGITGDYTCPSTTSQLYLYAVGGTPVGSSAANSATGLLAALGTCPANGTLSPSLYIIVNEVSTIATAYSIAGYATDPLHVSSPNTTLALNGIANAFATVPNLETLNTGMALATTATVNGGNGTVPQSEIDTLANILAACVNSGGPTSTTCSTLFSNAMNGSKVPADTATAAINMAHNPGANITTLYGLQTGNADFQPILSAAPNDFTLVVSYNGGGISGTGGIAIDKSGNVWVGNAAVQGAGSSISEFSPAGVALSPSTGYTGGGVVAPQAIAIDASGNVWVASGSKTVSAADVISKFSASGSPLSGSSGYTAGGLSDPFAIAIDASGNAWVSNHVSATITVLNSTGTPIFGSPLSGGGLASPHFVAIDLPGNIWVANNDNNSISKFNSSGGAISSSSGYTGGGLDEPYGVAIDGSGNVWVSNFFFNTLSELNSSGGAISPAGGYTGGGLNEPYGIAVDGSGYVWVANPGNNSISEFNSSGTAISGSSGFSSGSLSSPVDLAIDGSGNIWVTSYGGTAVGEYVGAATPVVTPLVANRITPYGTTAVNKP